MRSVLSCAPRYSLELLSNIGKYCDSLRGSSDNPQVEKFLMNNRRVSSSAFGLVGTIFYDIAKSDQPKQEDRKKAGQTSARVNLLVDLVDDIIDKRNGSLKEKLYFVEDVRRTLFGYRLRDYEQTGDIQRDSAQALAKRIHTDFLEDYEKPTDLELVFYELIRAVVEQKSETDPDKLVEIARRIGFGCTENDAVIVEMIDESEHPMMREAARQIGAYQQFLDHAYEIDEDLREGSNTYATAIIRIDGDSSTTRKRIRRLGESLAEESFMKGMEQLKEEKQRAIYQFLRLLTDIKYKFADKIIKF